jgi:hypothetical protein
MTRRSLRRLPLIAAIGLALLALAIAARPVAAQEPEAPPIDLELRLEPATASIGDHVTVLIVAEHDADVIVTARPPRGGSMELVSERLPETEALRNGRERTVIEFVVQPFAVGTLPLDEMRVDWLREDSTSGSIALSGEAIEVAALRAADDDALRALRPQAEVPGAPAAWVRPAVTAGIAAAVLALAGAAGALLWRRLRSRQPETAAPDMTAEERARASLNTLTGMRLRDDEAFQHYYGTLSVTVRGYLQERFGFNATALTTSELEEQMVSRGVDRWQARLVGGLLDRCDSAVYARHYPDPASADHDLTVAFEIVELSRPRAAAREEEAVGV